MTMIRLLGSIPREVTIAASGGVDSMAALAFLSNNHKVSAAFFDHGTATSSQALPVVEEFCKQRGITLKVGKISNQTKPTGLSPEEWWRQSRYAWLDSLDTPVVTAHHLDDCVETYLWSAMHGTPKVVPYRRNLVIRPFLLTRKFELVEWAERHSVPWIDDFSNKDTKYMRNYVREHIVPHALEVNPGLHRVVSRIVAGKALDS